MDSNQERNMREEEIEYLEELRAAAEEHDRPEGSAPQAAAASAAPGCHSNTRAYSSLMYLEGFPEHPFGGGIDWFEWTAEIEWIEVERFERYHSLLKNAKEECQEQEKSSTTVFIPDFGDIRVRRVGFNRGRERGQHFEYSLEARGLSLGISPRAPGKNHNSYFARRYSPNCVVKQTGRDCLLIGPQEGYELVEILIQCLGGKITETVLSRIDLCLDVVNLDVADLLAFVEKQHFITRFRNIHSQTNYVSGEITGFSAGTNPCRLIVYDKLLERESKRDALYYRALIDRRWQGYAPDKATRLEYQLSRKWLRNNGIQSAEDGLRLRGLLCHKLTHEIFRVTTQPVDRKLKHQSRAETHPLWVAFQKGFETVFGPPEGDLAPIQRERVAPDLLAKQARGCLASCLLQMGVDFTDYKDFLNRSLWVLSEVLRNPEDRKKFLEGVNRRKMEFETL